MAMSTSGPIYPPRANAPTDPTVAMTSLVSGLRRWYGLGVGGTSRAMRAGSSGSRSSARIARDDVAASTPPPRRRPSTLREAGDEATRQRLQQDEHHEERHGLVDRVGQQTLLQDRGGQVRAGLLERRDEEVRAGARDPAEDAGGDRCRDEGRHDPADQAGDGHIRHAEIPAHDQHDDESHQRQHDEQPDEVADDREEGVAPVGVEERERAVRVERDEPVVPDPADDEDEHHGADRQAAPVRVRPAAHEAELGDDAGKEADPRRDHGERRREVTVERRGQDIGPQQVGDDARDEARDRAGQDADEDGPDR